MIDMCNPPNTFQSYWQTRQINANMPKKEHPMVTYEGVYIFLLAHVKIKVCNIICEEKLL